MALAIVTEKNGYFEFKLDGEIILENKWNDLTLVPVEGGAFDARHCHFKTREGANILKKQNILITDVKVVAADTSEVNPVNSNQLYNALIAIHYFDWLTPGSGGGGSAGATKFIELLDTFSFAGRNGHVPVVNESENRLDSTQLFNYENLIQLADVEISPLTPTVLNKVVGVGIVDGEAKFVLQDPTGDQGTPADGILIMDPITRDVNTFTIPSGAGWRINGAIFSNVEDFVTTVPAESGGTNRIDIIVANQLNTFETISGTPAVGIAAAPPVPVGTLLVTIIQILGATVVDPEPPIIGDIYITKASKSTNYIYTDFVDINNLERDHRTLYKFLEGGIVRGVKINSSENFDNIYSGQKFTFYNASAENVTLIHLDPVGELKFCFPNEQNFVLLPNYTVEFFAHKSSSLQLVYIGASLGSSYSLSPSYINWSLDDGATITVPAGFMPMLVSLNNGRVLDKGTDYDMISSTQLRIYYSFEAGDTVAISGLNPTI